MSDAPFGRITDPQAFFSSQPRMFGPEGYTDQAREHLRNHLSPVNNGGLSEFAGVEELTARRAWMLCAAQQGYEGSEGANTVLLDAARAARRVVPASGDVEILVAGYLADSDRADERLEFTTLHIEMSSVGDHDRDVIAEVLHQHGLHVELETSFDGSRIVARLEGD